LLDLFETERIANIISFSDITFMLLIDNE